MNLLIFAELNSESLESITKHMTVKFLFPSAAITFIGMMIGAIIWGSLSDNVGRRRALLSALFVNAIFGLMTAFMPTYGVFMTTRLCSGIGYVDINLIN